MIEFFYSNLPWFWLILTVFFVVIEVLTFSLTTIWAALSSLVMIFLSLTKLDFKWQILIFALLTIVFLIFTRPFIQKKLKIKNGQDSVNSLIGQKVTIIADLQTASKIEAKTQNGVIWTVLPYENQELHKNDICTISEISGNILKVK